MPEKNNIVNPSYYAEDEDEIDLLDLFFYILRKYKAIIAAALICMIVFAAVGVIKEIRGQSANYESALEDYEKGYLAYQEAVKAKEIRIDSYEKTLENLEAINDLLEKKKKYLEDSIYLNLDSSNTAEAVKSWAIKVNDEEWENFKEGMIDPSDEIVSLYTANIKSVIDWDSVRKEMGEDSPYLDELVSIYNDANANTVSVRAYYTDIAGAEKLRDLVADQAEKIWDRERASLPGHARSLRLSSSRMTIIPGIDDSRKLQTDVIATYTDKITAISKNLDTMKNPYETEDPEEPEKPGAPGSDRKGIIMSGIKFAIIGILAGLFLSAGYFGFIYIAGGKIHTGDELKNSFRLEVFPVPSDARAANAIDGFIDTLSGSRKTNRESSLKRCAIRVGRISEGDRVMVTGTVPFPELKEFSDTLQSFASGLTLTPAENVTVSNDTLGMIEDKTEILLVEKKNSSKKIDVSEELRYILDQKGKILGIVLLE